MAKYKSTPGYEVVKGGGEVRVVFDYAGEYETSDKKEIDVLDGICPRYATRVDEPKPVAAKQPEDAPSKPSAAPKTKGGKSGKSSAK